MIDTTFSKSDKLSYYLDDISSILDFLDGLLGYHL